MCTLVLHSSRSTRMLSTTICLHAGAGLGRLCLEVAALGYEAQGNEFSYYMLLASSFLLNHMQRPNQWTLFPWLHTNCNQRCVADQFRAVSWGIPGPCVLQHEVLQDT